MADVPPAPPVAPPLPWEQPGYPPLEALFETAKLVLLQPRVAFARVAAGGDLGRPLLFAVIFGWVGIIASQVYNIFLGGWMWSFLPGMRELSEQSMPLAWNLVTMVVAPVLVLLGVFLGAAVLHLFLLLVGGAGSGFTATLKVVCYAGSTQVLQILPVCGSIVGFVWSVVVHILGLAQAHRTSEGKAAVAVLLPVVLCCACAAVGVALFGAAIFAAVQGDR